MIQYWYLLLFSFFCPLYLHGAYQIHFEGAPTIEILSIIESVSHLNSEKSRPPPTLFTLKKRAESDKKILVQVLHAYGYYEGTIRIEYLGTFPDTTVTVQIESGPEYHFGPPLLSDENGENLRFPDLTLDLKEGCLARADVILDTQDQILEHIACLGYPLAKIERQQVVVDQKTKTVHVSYILCKNERAFFGPVVIDGLRKIRRALIHRQIQWREGELYNPHSIACTNAYLQGSGLFSLVSIRPSDRIDENGYLPMLIALEEKKYRHIGCGVGYSTDESVGGTGQWSHDNLTGWGDSFSLLGEYSSVIKRATVFYTMPDVFRRNQNFVFSTEWRREDAPGFIEQELSVLARVERKVNNCFSFNYSGRYERLMSTKSDNNENYHLFSLPIQIRYDTSDRLLNPTKGTLATYLFTPYQSALHDQFFFLKQEFLFAGYLPITTNGNLIFAFSAQVGSISGQNRRIIPAPKRFYAGSSTGLRGYSYLTVSPLCGTKPVGGRSLMIFQLEPRYRIWNKLYFAAFYDFGNVYSSPFPELDKRLLTSAGCGIRYLTPLGPFRLDIGFPLEKRKGIDNSFQIYASIGQTF